MSRLQMVHTLGRHVDLAWGEQPLFRYVYQPDTPSLESPRPYFHPLHTLAGDVITGFRPNDHRWHHGLSMTVAYLSGENFWGGVTYQDGGYVQLNNNGRQQHTAWDALTCDGEQAALDERLTWLTHAGEVWFEEQRRIGVSASAITADAWSLELGLRLRNVTHQPLVLGSPTTQGRPNAGYGGLTWRGARDLTRGTIQIESGLIAHGDEEPLMGQRGRWLAYTGRHDGAERASTIILVDQPGNPRYPNRWFVRAKEAPYASFALFFDQTYTLEPGAELALTYRLIVVSGAPDAIQIEALIADPT
ncbi:MAG: hypothetical protein GXY36_13710 [Chloroflexi bacterium]|nr:hypothetical protein [Chloroflexota bacterium]